MQVEARTKRLVDKGLLLRERREACLYVQICTAIHKIVLLSVFDMTLNLGRLGMSQSKRQRQGSGCEETWATPWVYQPP